jgi:hypothetical protein
MIQIRLTTTVIIEVTSEDCAQAFIDSVTDDLDAVLAVLDEHEGPTIITADVISEDEDALSKECRFCGEPAVAGCCQDCYETFIPDNHS